MYVYIIYHSVYTYIHIIYGGACEIVQLIIICIYVWE